MKRHTLKSYFVVAICFTAINSAIPAHADTELENAALARIVNVLNSLKPIINEAERQQDKNTRVQFQYDALRNDIDQIKAGIVEKLKQPSIEPRIVTPIQGDYLIFRGKHS